MSLNPKITKDTNGVYWLIWTPDPTAEGYAFTTPTGKSRTFDPTRDRTKLGDNLIEPIVVSISVLDVTTRGAESASFPAVVDPPPPDGNVAPPIGPFTVLDGNQVQSSFGQAFVRTTGPSKVQKLHVKNVTGWGAGAMQYYPPSVNSPGRQILEDCIVENVHANPPKSMDGTGESCYWFGNPTTARRFLAKDGAWMGMWTGSKCIGTPADPCLFEDFEIIGPYVGLYVEHETRNAIFRRFKINSKGNGINIEWWYGGGGSNSLLFEDGDIYCPNPSNLDYRSAGIFADAGTFDCTFRRIRFWGPGNAIGLPNKLKDPSKPNKVEDCIFENAGKKIYYHDNNIG